MFSALMERTPRDRFSGSTFLTLAVVSAYTAVAAIGAGAVAVPAGLFVLALGALATVTIDHAMWRELAFAAPAPRAAREPVHERVELLAAPLPQAALPKPDRRELVDFSETGSGTEEPAKVSPAPRSRSAKAKAAEPEAADPDAGDGAAAGKI